MVKMHFRGDKIQVYVSDQLLRSGWYGGQWVKYTGKRIVDLATETVYTGFLLLGHKFEDLNGVPYDYKDGYPVVPFGYENSAVNAYGQTIMITGGGDYDFNLNVYDTTKTYSYNQNLYVNNNSVLTNVDVGEQPVGVVNTVPSDNNGWLGVTLRY